ncbi:ATP-binding cassette domain-containing protein [Ureaplasma diversum]|uniref:ABC transporter, permease component, putative cobalt transport protein CbiO n=1 Tax=Ureaplasma diversum NCTC 246 TaxID=1188241 RepID=A0A084EZM2_9BACT|nr:ATP-binding cassette domain-containing protein [Ureaplasma diversum]KEZ23414.1 ABC transporter, permease component, putative cobalt transport protein CbiO [Ureaplasma diversum NCTC 246]
MSKLNNSFLFSFKKASKPIRTVDPNLSVKVSNLYAIYDEKAENQLVALNNVSFDFLKNKIYFIIGNSGSGKSTLVTHFNGLLVSRYGYVQVGDIVVGDHFDLTDKLLAVIDSRDHKVNNLLWKNQLDQWTFLVLYSNEVNTHQAKILFEAIYKHRPKSLYFLKNPEFIKNPYVRANTKVAIVRVNKDVILEINDKLSFDDLQAFEFVNKPIKTNYKRSKKLKRFKDLRKRVGFVFQFPEYQLFKDTIEKDIMFGPMNLGVSKIEAKKRAKIYLNKLGLDDSYLERSPFGLSGGQKRRVAIAGILAMENDVLVFDEPTAGLDPAGEQEMMDIITDAKANNKTVFVITHTMEHVLEVADEVVYMDQGEIIKHGTPYDIFFDDEIINNSSIQVPRVIAVIKSLLKADQQKWAPLINEFKPKTVQELAEAISTINKQTKRRSK